MPAIDQPILAGDDLVSLELLATDPGFDPVYGGAHANGETECRSSSSRTEATSNS